MLASFPAGEADSDMAKDLLKKTHDCRIRPGAAGRAETKRLVMSPRGPLWAVALAVLLAGCAGSFGGEEVAIEEPTATGSAPTPVPGPQVAAVATTSLLSLFDATEIAGKLARTDFIYAERSGQESLEYYRSGTQGRWQNPDTGNAGTITPTRTYQLEDGTYCREFEQMAIAGGVSASTRGTACRQPDASWRLVP